MFFEYKFLKFGLKLPRVAILKFCTWLQSGNAVGQQLEKFQQDTL